MIKLYKFEGKTILISEYTQVLLKRVIVILLNLKEGYISTIYVTARTKLKLRDTTKYIEEY
jgi:hypothetical protein